MGRELFDKLPIDQKSRKGRANSKQTDVVLIDAIVGSVNSIHFILFFLLET